MIKKMLTASSVFLPLLLAAQLTVNVQLPPAGMIQKDQLWNLVVVNNNKELVETVVSLELQDAVTGQTVLSAGSRSFLLGKGVKVLSIKDVQPVLYNYQASEFTGTFIPLGSYVACYRIFKTGFKGPEPLGDECVRLNINPLSPPMLTTPLDRTTLESTYPSFSWLPPSPTDMFTSLSYDIAVAEVLQGQSPAEAILYNTPVYTDHNLKIPYKTYPSGFSRLKQGQQYAWQVTARNGLSYAAQTEVWTFAVKPADSSKENSVNGAYIQLTSQGSSGVSYITGTDLFVKYYSFDKDHETVVRLYGQGNRTPVQEIRQTIIYGNNFLYFKLNNQYKKGETYSVEIADQQKNIYKTQFSIQ